MKIIIVLCVLSLWDVTIADSEYKHQQEIDINDFLKLIQKDNKIKNSKRPDSYDSDHDLIKPNMHIARIFTPMKTLFKSDKSHSNDGKFRYGTKKQLGIKSEKVSSSLKSENHDWANIVKAVKRFHQKREQIKNPSMIFLNSKPKSKPKPKFKDLTYRLLDFLDSGVSPESSSRTKVNEIGDLKVKKIQDLLNKGGQIEFNVPQNALDKKTQKIQDALNSLPLVQNDQLTLDEKTRMIQASLNRHALVEKPKLSQIDGDKYIQDLLKSKGFGKEIIVGDDIFNSENYNSQKNSIIDEENNANEMLDPELLEDENSVEIPNGRRASYTHKKRRRYRNRDSKYESFEKEYSGASASSDYEKNPGNPFTIHRNKYKQNWIWNHVMDGDHMNVNPFGPPFAQIGPSGADLFFGRKWWYYNQDDYKPLG